MNSNNQRQIFLYTHVVTLFHKRVIGGSTISVMAVLAINAVSPILCGLVESDTLDKQFTGKETHARLSWIGEQAMKTSKELWRVDGTLNEKLVLHLEEEITKRLRNHPDEAEAMLKFFAQQKTIEHFFAALQDEIPSSTDTDMLGHILAMSTQIQEDEQGIEHIVTQFHEMLAKTVSKYAIALLTNETMSYLKTVQETLETIQQDTVYIQQRIDQIHDLLKNNPVPLKIEQYHQQEHALAESLLAALPLDTIPELTTIPYISRMLYAPNPLFVGRADSLKNLAAVLKQETPNDTPNVAVITGMGGIGKTQLASEFVHRYGQFFHGGVYWLSFADGNNIPNEIVACGGIGAMNLPGFDTLSFAEQVERVQEEWQSSTPRLLIFDSCSDEALLQQWLPKTGGCRVLVTSRRETWDTLPDMHVHSLDILPREESIALLRLFRPDVAATDANLHLLAAELGDLPLALHLAGNYLKTFEDDITIDQYLEELCGEQLLGHESLQGVDNTISPTDHELHVGKTFIRSYNKLHKDNPRDALALILLSNMANFPLGTPIPQEELLQTAGISRHHTEEWKNGLSAIKRLTGLGLLHISNENNITTLRLHRLLAIFIQNSNHVSS